MKRLSLFAAFFVAVSCFGQSIGQTTLAVGASPTDTTITLVSSAGVSAAAGTTVVTGLFIEHEYIEVQTNGGTNVWTVRRAAGGFRGPHLAGTTVYVGRPFDFGVGVTNSRTNPKGNCVAGAQALPYVVIATGDVFTCPTTGANAGIWTLLTPAGSVVTEDVSGNVTVPGNLNFLGNIYRNGTLFSGTWGGIGGTLSAQTDLWTALGGKQPTIAGAPGTWPLSFTPSAHASTHQNGGADEIATAAPAANAIPKAGAGGTLAAGWIPALNYQAPITGAPGTWPTLTNTVFGRSGAVTAQNGDYTTTQVTEGTNLYFTVLRAQAAISISGSYLGYTGGVLSVSGLQPTITGAPGTWPSFATVATSGSYTDLSNKPTIAAASSTTPLMDGTAAIGSAATYAKADHVHPTDTSRQATITGAPGTWPSTFAPTAHASTHAGAGSDPITSLGAVSFTGTISVQAGVANAMSISGNGGLYATFTNADASSYPYFSFSRSRGTIASPTSVQVGDTVGGVNFYATGPGGGGYGVAGMTALATGFNGNNILGKFSVNVGDGTSAGANFNAFTATSTLTTFNTPLQVGTYLLERTFPTTTFANGTANQKVDIVFGNVQMVGTFEVTLTGSYNSYPSIGRITKVYSVGVGTGGAVYSGNGTHYSEASGNVPNSFALGDLVWDTTNLVWRIQIADLNNSSGNIYVSIKSLGFAPLSTEVAAATLGSIYTTDSTVLATAAVSFPGPSVVTFSGTGVNLPKVLGTTIIANPNDSSNNLLVAGLTNGIRLGSSLTTATISGVDPTGYASFQPLQINGSFVTLNSSSTEIARVTSTGLGVGTTSPGYRLDVSGIARFDTGGGGNGVLMLGGVSHANTGSFIMSDSGYGSNYNGLYIASNTISSTYTQANTAFSSWGLDIGGYDNITFSGSADSFNILRQAAGGTTPSRLFTVSNTGTVKVTATADSSVNMLVTGLTKAVRIGSSTAAANIDGIDPTGTTSYQPLQINGSFVSFGNSGTEVLRATGGSVGIGTTSPDGTLHVAGTTQITWSTSANTALAIIGSRGTVGGSLWVNTPSYGASYPSGLGVSGTYASSISTVQLGAYGTCSGGPYGSVLSFLTTNQTTASEKMRIDQNGKVGIATTSPAYGLDVANGVGLSGTARFYDQTATTGATLVTITAGASQTVASTVLSVGGVVKFAGTNSTGSGSALLGANSPATVVSAPYTWIKAIASDGTTVFLPAWK